MIANAGRNVVIFGSAITSTRANGAAIFFRCLASSFARMGMQTIFAEERRDLVFDENLPQEIEIQRYSTPFDVADILDCAKPPRLVLKFVACGSMDAELEEQILLHKQPSDLVLFVDGDAPVTLEVIHRSPEHPLRHTVPTFDGVLILAGGERAAEEYLALGARMACWGYCAVDDKFWQPVSPLPQFECDLLFVGNRLADRDTRVEEFFFRPGRLCPDKHFLLVGLGWDEVSMPSNVLWIGHLQPNALRQAYSSARLTLNVNREPMARYGYSPASRLFEAAGCGACVITDRWPGVEELFVSGDEMVVASSAADVAAAVEGLTESVRRQIGRAARLKIESNYNCDRWVRRLFTEFGEMAVSFGV